MFVRSCWKPTEEDLWKLVEANPWALLVNNGPEGPFATNLPLILDRTREKPVLVSHIARANEHAQALREAATPTLAIFHGPVSYVTASWYPQRDMPSTYYYTAVHCYGRVRIQDQPDLRASLEELTRGMESKYPAGWKTSEIPPQDITRRLPAIMGFELEVDRAEGKFKLGQDEPVKDALAVGNKLAESSDPAMLHLSELVIRYNRGRTSI
ncbi:MULTISPECIES: FMN-binding negative transcriptional regulator [Acidobacterium]|uniref:Transcription repressor of sporulation and degradative enzymes production paiB, putative n=1 Tax=Acidobacterium capsulatum (strain ATCC 51196 / DSM 11244 / BCRC 80197 / JCM 7670 / NBRC 15755 / NCIMB 13165 / 161) TaxID=240015 RepID=C1F7F8_ACIC5|nr:MULTISPECIES: FMN-binding negative transcriptional regulator [Acidobacterium]ACO31766.1 transcription repressor of sporulation and degradative enzymes production paiB, putative [Acidobacterium capsulatum ATCC 51196]